MTSGPSGEPNLQFKSESRISKPDTNPKARNPNFKTAAAGVTARFVSLSLRASSLFRISSFVLLLPASFGLWTLRLRADLRTYSICRTVAPAVLPPGKYRIHPSRISPPVPGLPPFLRPGPHRYPRPIIAQVTPNLPAFHEKKQHFFSRIPPEHARARHGLGKT
jgi:hypothetical protein